MRGAGIAIIYISHRLREVIEIADEVTVLRDGVLIKSCPIADITSTDMIRLMVGREVTDLFPKMSAILILDEPTRGVDVAAKAEIHSIIGKMVASGMAVLMISSEMAEVLAVCDRVVVMHEGRARSTLTRDQLSEEKIMSLAAGEDLQ